MGFVVPLLCCRLFCLRQDHAMRVGQHDQTYDPPASSFPSANITGMHHYTCLDIISLDICLIILVVHDLKKNI